jgi:hypothetical protein
MDKQDAIKKYPPISGCIVSKIDAIGIDDCIAMALQVAPDHNCVEVPVDERADDLMRLSSLITARYGYVAILHDENRLAANGAGRSWILPIPSDALSNHCAALKAGTIYGSIKEIIHGS